MRLTALLALSMLVATSASGCILFMDCNVHTRRAVWPPDYVPVPPAGSIDYEQGNLWGGIGKHPDTGEIHLIVHANQSVSHEELVGFAQALFAERGWPPPDFEIARESSSCGDDY